MPVTQVDVGASSRHNTSGCQAPTQTHLQMRPIARAKRPMPRKGEAVAERPDLRLIDAATGEIVKHDEREILVEQLQAELRGKSLTIGKLKRELKELRAVEPEAETIRGVLEYWRSKCSPRAQIAIAGKRWEKVRARLRDKLDGRDPWTPPELKLAVDGALLDPWLSGRDRRSRGYLDAETIFRDAEMVEKLRNLAIGFEARAGLAVGELLDVADELALVDWKLLLRVCVCRHRRIEHHRPSPREGCLAPDCPCEDFDLSTLDPFNLRADPWLRRWHEKAS